MNVLAHMKEHEMIAMQMAQLGMEQEAAASGTEGEESSGYEGEME
jgi:hypothetical protein